MAAGRPIVANDITGYAELLAPAGCARLSPPGDADALARDLVAVLSDASLARTMSEHARAASRRYDWRVVAARLDEIYRGLVPGAH